MLVVRKRTLTDLYDTRPTRLADAKLDAAVLAACGWRPHLSDDQVLEWLLELSLARAAQEG